MSLKFTWNRRKADLNQRKHGVSFQEAVSAFKDEQGLIAYDPDHSVHEDRWLLFGLSEAMRVLIISYTSDEDETEIRIISARGADRDETAKYFRRKR